MRLHNIHVMVKKNCRCDGDGEIVDDMIMTMKMLRRS